MQTASGARLDLRRAAVLALCLGLGWYFWDWPALWPLKLLVVMMHESGHALATLLVGGEVERIALAANEGGSCLSQLPSGVLRQVAVYSAGYVGSSLVGALLLLATFRFRLRRVVLGAACAWLAAMGALYARDTFTLSFCLGTAVVLGLAARFLPDGAADLLNLFLAAFTALYAVMDLRMDLWDGAVRRESDAALLAHLTGVPSVLWAVLWTVVSVGVLSLFAWWSLKAAQPRHPGLPLPELRRV